MIASPSQFIQGRKAKGWVCGETRRNCLWRPWIRCQDFCQAIQEGCQGSMAKVRPSSVILISASVNLKLCFNIKGMNRPFHHRPSMWWSRADSITLWPSRTPASRTLLSTHALLKMSKCPPTWSSVVLMTRLTLTERTWVQTSSSPRVRTWRSRCHSRNRLCKSRRSVASSMEPPSRDQTRYEDIQENGTRSTISFFQDHHHCVSQTGISAYQTCGKCRLWNLHCPNPQQCHRYQYWLLSQYQRWVCWIRRARDWREKNRLSQRGGAKPIACLWKVSRGELIPLQTSWRPWDWS